MPRSIPLYLLLLSLCRTPVSAHHGQDFFLLEDYELPSPGHGHLMSTFDAERTGGSTDLYSEPGITLGLLPRVAFSAGTAFGDTGNGWRYFSVTPRLHFQLTPPELESPFRISLSLGRTFQDGALGGSLLRETLLTPETVQEEPEVITVSTPATDGSGDGGSGEATCDPAIDVDCIPSASVQRVPKHSGHSGGETATVTTVTKQPGSSRTVYRRTVRERSLPGPQDAWNARLVMQADFGKVRAVVNAGANLPDGESLEWTYAAGVRYQISHDLAAGIEAAGEFEEDSAHQLIGGVYWNATHSLTLRLGVGTSLGGNGPDVSLHTGVLWRF